MSAPLAGASWATVEDIPEHAVGMWSATEWAGLLATATSVLWAATGRRWRGVGATATVTLRAAQPRPGEGSWPYHSSWGRCGCHGGQAGAVPSWVAPWAGSHHAPAAVRLPHSDVTSVTSVTVDGAAFTAYRLDGPWLARTDGNGWAVCGEQTVVAYVHGHAPPAGGREAVVELAVELGRSSSQDPDQACRLPQRVQSVTRQGLTYREVDPIDYLDKGLTGIFAVDLWVKAVNPDGRRQAARVWSPDLPYARRT